MLFKYLDLDKKDKEIKLPITEKEFNFIKDEVKGVSLDDLYDWRFWDIRDYLFKEIIIKPHTNKVKSFFEKIQLNDFDFVEDENQAVRVVDIYFHVYIWNSVFIAAEPNNELYDDKIYKDRLECDIEFELEEIEHLLRQILDAFEVEYITIIEEEQICTIELEIDDLMEDFFRECWLEKKAFTKSSMIGVLFQATGYGTSNDIETGEEIVGEIKEYALKKGIEII